MRATNEITVDRMEFKKAAAWTRRGRSAIRDETILAFGEDGFTVETPRAVTKIKSVGRWSLPVAVNASILKRLASRLPVTKELTLLYVNRQLAVGPTRISAREIELE